jgi:adenylylsulfate kinase
MMNEGNAALDEQEGPKTARMGAALWFTGLPGSGKSTLVRAVRDELKRRGMETYWLQMDARRKLYFPKPVYSTQERREAYRLFAEEAAELTRQSRVVLMDAAAPELAMRRYARGLIPRFAEVHLRCGVATAMAREAKRPDGLVMAGLYAKAMKRKVTGEQFEGLGEVIGVDVPFEEDPTADLVLDAASLSTDTMRDKVLERFAVWLSPSPEA